MSERKCLRSNEKNTTNNILASAKLHVPKISYVCLANRSACFLKLGHPEKALDDAESCVKLDPSYIKGVFRQGMALHALERFEEAIPVLAKSLEMEPKNKQVKQVRVWEGGGGWGVGGCENCDPILPFLAKKPFLNVPRKKDGERASTTPCPLF